MTTREPEYYDYGHGETTESYESYGEDGQKYDVMLT